MKKTMISYALLLGMSPFLVQCIATEQDLRGLEMRTRVMDDRIHELERLNETVRGQATSQARLGNELENLGNRQLQHEGRMEEVEHRLQLFKEEFHNNQQATSIRLDNIDITLQEIQRRLDDNDQHLADSLAELTGSLQALKEQQERNQRQLQELKEELAREAARRAEAAQQAAEQARREAEERARRQPTAAPSGTPRQITPENVKQKVGEAPVVAPTTPAARPSRPEPAPTPAPAEDDYYSQGLRQLERNNYREAYTAFARYLEEEPRGENAADARFRLGESLFGQQEYELAILEYQKVIADFSGHDRVPAAMLRQGVAFEELREPATAAIIYERLIGEFPNRREAQQARERLEKIN
ncbi:tol-pal system protein YbgF [Desulfurivibrio alkaliphilus]|uniref:Tol-pal system protein YbgF n=1 Tax=Desulfurivibrio alkaliphilus (strain DSM 19089 / UNIQEM U267 / AHT2) TaxID=589865 RepID=D6Z219_DESAT|nr:tol-pal system protein YbgF [Desulfurivibrio alkaliphilus]ADH85594.1 tol-pal system protein YbgF [Desulfurivibrio alkaliphilus AHT 2]